MEDILKAIPHRPPFLFVDRVIELGDGFIKAEKEVLAELDFFKGHYPGFPVMPGALTCEALFQTGAILLSGMVEKSDGRVPVVTRIKNGRFKRMIRPGDTVTLTVKLAERIGDVFYLHGDAKVGDALAADIDFACTLAEVKG